MKGVSLQKHREKVFALEIRDVGARALYIIEKQEARA